MAKLQEGLNSSRLASEPIMSITATAGVSVGAMQWEMKFTQHFGHRDHARSPVPDDETIYALGSLTKAMVAQAVGYLVDEAVVTWQTVVSEVVSGFCSKD